MTINVHNHGPNEGRGVDCGEPRLADGSFIGWCQILPVIRKVKEQAWQEGAAAGLHAGLAIGEVCLGIRPAPIPPAPTNPYTEEP